MKQYLRGLGIGILVTAMICGISDSVRNRRPMSDEEIKARARQLGMIEGNEVLIQSPAAGVISVPSTLSSGSAAK